jgi:hypothetical protein
MTEEQFEALVKTVTDLRERVRVLEEQAHSQKINKNRSSALLREMTKDDALRVISRTWIIVMLRPTSDSRMLRCTLVAWRTHSSQYTDCSNSLVGPLPGSVGRRSGLKRRISSAFLANFGAQMAKCDARGADGSAPRGLEAREMCTGHASSPSGADGTSRGHAGV